MRIFIEHKADILPVVERGRIVGQLDRAAIIEALSEIKPEGCHVTLSVPESTEALLRRLDKAENGSLPTLNRQFEFNALWGRAEILQAQGKIPQIKIWQPGSAVALPLENPTPAETPRAETPAALAPSNAVSPQTISIVRETPLVARSTPAQETPDAVRPTHDKAEKQNLRAPAEKFHRELERGRLAINTLAALELPLMACDGSGNELFHNRAFGALRKKFAASLQSDTLLRRAKDAIAESALKGDLDIERPVKLRGAVPGYLVCCKAIRDFDDPSARAQGYIFWLEEVIRTPNVATDLAVADDGKSDFSGRTLPEILAAEEYRAMAWAMREANGNQTDAALLLGIPRQTFNYRYRKLLQKQASASKKHSDAKIQENGQ